MKVSLLARCGFNLSAADHAVRVGGFAPVGGIEVRAVRRFRREERDIGTVAAAEPQSVGDAPRQRGTVK
jgi:hypothetical protein